MMWPHMIILPRDAHISYIIKFLRRKRTAAAPSLSSQVKSSQVTGVARSSSRTCNRRLRTPRSRPVPSTFPPRCRGGQSGPGSDARQWDITVLSKYNIIRPHWKVRTGKILLISARALALFLALAGSLQKCLQMLPCLAVVVIIVIACDIAVSVIRVVLSLDLLSPR